MVEVPGDGQAVVIEALAWAADSLFALAEEDKRIERLRQAAAQKEKDAEVAKKEAEDAMAEYTQAAQKKRGRE